MSRPSRSTFYLAILLLCSLWVMVSSSQVFASPSLLTGTFIQQYRLQAADASFADSFGASLVKDGNTLLVGATHAAYVFVQSGNTWVQQAKFTAPSGSSTRFLGSSIALNGDTALVDMVPNYDFGLKGAVLVYVRSGTTWTLQATLTPGDGDPRQDFGVPHFLDSNTILVGAPSGDYNAPGSVYIFVRNGTTWTEVGKFSASDAHAIDTFGSTFASEGNTVVIGAPYSHQPAYGTGAVYVFQRNGTTFTEQAKITLTNPGYFANFGSSIDLDGNTILVGAKQEDGLRGSAYVYTGSGSTWTQQAKLVPADIVNPPGSVNFGTSVSLEGDTAVVGATRNPTESRDRGGVYVFTRNAGNWTQYQKLLPQDNQSKHVFGSGVQLDGEQIFIGAPAWLANRHGDVFVFQRTDTPPATELLVNGGFDGSQTNGVPNGWTRKNTTKDERRCNKSNQPPVAHSGSCAYFMKGGETGGKLAQNVNLYQFNLQAGDVVRLNGFYNKQSTGSVYVYLYVSYANFPEDQRRIILTQPTPNQGYQPINQSTITLKETPTRIRVVLENQTTSGKTWFDGLNLIATTDSQNNLLSLPLSLDEQPQTEPLIPLP